jgi:23S rRNA pseudouridine1911/1915/1917 synthase
MEDKFHFFSDKDDVRVDAYLAGKLSLPRARVKNLIEEGHIRVDNRIPKPSMRLKKDSEIEGEITRETPFLLVAEDIPVKILFEDDYLLVIDKPKDMVVHPSAGHRQGTLVNAVLNYVRESDREGDERPGIVHRLDKGTTGVIIIAKDRKTQEMLSREFHERKVEKVYRAVVEGAVRDQQGIVEGELGRHPKDRKKMALVPRGGRYSFSEYRILERLKGFTYVEVYPKTGRTHQIRVHMASIGHPIVGDDLYGKIAKRHAVRPLLHALKIGFEHPATKERLSVAAPVPADMEEFVEKHKGDV